MSGYMCYFKDEIWTLHSCVFCVTCLDKKDIVYSILYYIALYYTTSYYIVYLMCIPFYVMHDFCVCLSCIQVLFYVMCDFFVCFNMTQLLCNHTL